jgi:nicotinic acid mononucleotide adenylyltransferase
VFAVVKRFGVEIQVPAGFDFVAVPGDIQGISSTGIRETVSKSKKVESALKDLVPTEVAKYIATVGLYK